MQTITSISGRFKKVRSECPDLGSYIILSKALRGMKYGRMKCYEAFNKYVPKNDYAPDEKDILMDRLVVVTNSDKPAQLNGSTQPSEK